jgi:two-component sensor histidine kinase
VKPSFLYIFLFFFFSVAAQEYNYVHYDTKDGLAGSTVYRMCQDTKGYIWFGTDNGVSMFDGKTFKNFTTAEGLPDNDILFLFPDSKGRVWMSPFNKSVCYYYEGKIYNRQNDSTLKNVLFASFGFVSGENAQGGVYFSTDKGVSLLNRSGEIKLIGDYKKIATRYSLKESDFLPVTHKNSPGGILLYNTNFLFVEKNDSFVFLKKIKSNPSLYNNFLEIDEDLEMQYPHPTVTSNYSTIIRMPGEEKIYNTLNGSWLIDSKGFPYPTPFLPGKKVSNSLRDNEGNLWFSTIGEGVYRLSSMSMKTFTKNQEFFCMDKLNGKIYTGCADGSLKVIKNFRIEKEIYFPAEPRKEFTRRLYTMKADSSGNIFLGFDPYLVRMKGDEKVFLKINPVKSIDIIDRNYIVAATNAYTFKIRSADLRIVDTIWRERGTKVIYDKGYYYIGTLNGLVIIDSGKTTVRIGQDNPLLNKRIVDMCRMGDGSFWIATNDNGILLYRNGRVDTVINAQNGLSSNICKSVFIKDNYLWVGTNKGLNKIDTRTNKVLIRYSASEGLASDVINAIYAEDSIIWVCSPAGITYFNEKDISDSSLCGLNLTAVHVSGRTTNTPGDLHLSYKNNNISFEYTAISFKSAGEIIYHYKLTGLDETWKQTSLNSLTYPSLPPGDYEFRLFAVNKFGRQSDAIIVPFSIAAPFWKLIWFWVAVTLFAVCAVWYLLSLRFKNLQKRMKEKNELLQRMTELEQVSLRAQMNPHFIFNCLNSIQHFILKNDIKQTNRYIAQFGSLIRQTMDNSVHATISISDELNYLTSYLDLEKMRFSSSFDYEISIDKNLQADYIHIPSMLLQPFVENAIRHGIRYKQEGKGIIRIGIRQDNDNILFTVEDNGVGREAAAKYKSEQHIEYQSKGITLTQKRVELLNENHSQKISTKIIDLKDENGRATGTKVLLSFPLPVIDKFRTDTPGRVA